MHVITLPVDVQHVVKIPAGTNRHVLKICSLICNYLQLWTGNGHFNKLLRHLKETCHSVNLLLMMERSRSLNYMLTIIILFDFSWKNKQVDSLRLSLMTKIYRAYLQATKCLHE